MKRHLMKRKDGTAETTTNEKCLMLFSRHITIGAGETISTTELRIQAGSDATLGNPQISRPLAVCFKSEKSKLFSEKNVSGSGAGSSTGDWDETFFEVSKFEV